MHVLISLRRSNTLNLVVFHCHCHLVVQLVKSRDNNKKLRLKIESKPSKDLEFDDGKVCENRGQLFVLCNSNILYNYTGLLEFCSLFFFFSKLCTIYWWIMHNVAQHVEFIKLANLFWFYFWYIIIIVIIHFQSKNT